MVIVYIGTCYIHVLYLGRAPRTKETLPDFHEWRRVTRHPLVFRRLTGSQRTPRIGVSHHRSGQASPHCDHLRGVCRDHAPWSGYFILLRQRLGGRLGFAAPPVKWYCGLHGPVVPLAGTAPIW